MSTIVSVWILGDLLGLPVKTLPNTQFLIGQFDPYPGAPPEQDERLLRRLPLRP